MGGNDKLTGPSLKPATNLEDWNTTSKQFAGYAISRAGLHQRQPRIT
jgi:hypothetical protein